MLDFVKCKNSNYLAAILYTYDMSMMAGKGGGGMEYLDPQSKYFWTPSEIINPPIKLALHVKAHMSYGIYSLPGACSSIVA